MSNNQNTNILVTGATGFIGSYLCKELIQKEYNVFGLFLSNESQILRDLLNHERFTLIKGDILDFNLIDKTIRENKIKVIFHLAAVLPQKDDIKNPFLIFDVNAKGTLNLLNVAYLNGVEKFIYTSSSSVYSEPPEYLPVDENHPTRPLTIYGASKLAGELYCDVYSKLMSVTILRYCGAYGRGQDSHYATHRFVTQALKNEPITIYGTGNQTTNFTHINDIVSGTILAMEKGKPGIYNISNGEETSVINLARKIIKITNSKSKIILTNEDTDRSFRFSLNINRARECFDYSPLSLNEGLSVYISEVNND